jgi:hypothetical protein
VKYLCVKLDETDNKNDNTSGVFRHYPVAFSRKHAGSFSFGSDSRISHNFPCPVDPQPGFVPQDIAQVAVWLDTVAAAVLNDRVDHRTAFSGVGVSEEQPILLFMEMFP